ncbi:MAG: hypothetical protein A2015_09330 [Spirochaetes bacterium GWF1_31_7]|nr:MAG: hypothetical protein A2Y30_08890 [Spirochaetes bacterium GWE1_32_154]OHD45693.1 MAG: hypothetical protein A2Y29_10245 [Spirochaetes bacterium GWE2_31_10]OHD47687.1 MAG: hypothetical protein A2015_09330 [Spirochaetes bacterium GWF1_31_7]OHD74779.1 MAG: hypothetical protein A2355_06915 [Spirochaetes bacterium RIFOXYB1_FULL_32_8]HBD94792.1 phosphoribosyl-AMP cyclohydrolase [Spirochaetia bacterium]
MNKLSDYITFNSDGLVPVIAQEYKSNIVLMLAYASKEALDYTVETGKATYFSRSRNKIWCKGEESGNYQQIVDIRIDCDNDTVLYIVKLMGLKAACHTGHKSCFYTSYKENSLIENDKKLYFSPEDVYKK